MKEEQISLQEQIAFDLQRQFGADWDFAWLTHQGKIFFSRYPKNLLGPSSAIVKLIQFLFDEQVDQSFFILRNRIYSTSKSNPMCEGMVQLAAKRVTCDIQVRDHVQTNPYPMTEVGDEEQHFLRTRHLFEVNWKAPEFVEDPIEAYFYLQDLIAQIPRGEILHDFNRPIAALLCDANGKLLSWAVNNNSKNKTLHAEINAIQKYFDTFGCKLPAGARIYTSLKPCRMCAGMIVQMAENPDSLKAVYFQDDPGPLAQQTELEKRQALQHYLLQDASPQP